MKIYFSGSIRAGRADVAIYKIIIDELKLYGEVLTEHIGNDAITQSGEMNLTEKEIFYRDMGYLRSADVVVAEVTTPSLGVGYEIGQARAMGIPVFCLYRGDHRTLSGMIVGDEIITTKYYTKVTELPSLIKTFMAGLTTR